MAGSDSFPHGSDGRSGDGRTVDGRSGHGRSDDGRSGHGRSGHGRSDATNATGAQPSSRQIFEIGAHWRLLVQNWVARRNYHTVTDTVSVSLRFDLQETGRTVTVRFMTTKRLLVAFATDGNYLRHDQLAIAAAASNAWNTEQLNPMLSVWDVRGPRPCLAGVCDLPLTCRITQADFDALAGDWVDRARQMFLRCHQVFKL